MVLYGVYLAYLGYQGSWWVRGWVYIDVAFWCVYVCLYILGRGRWDTFRCLVVYLQRGEKGLLKMYHIIFA
jgi:hypothetical protein